MCVIIKPKMKSRQILSLFFLRADPSDIIASQARVAQQHLHHALNGAFLPAVVDD